MRPRWSDTRRIAPVVALVALAVGGCGAGLRSGGPDAGSGVDGASTTAVHHDHGVVTRVYEVGKDIEPGVYTTESVGCSAVATPTPDDDVMAGSSAGALLTTSVRVGDLERIVLREGEFFQVDDCATWKREAGRGPRTPDPATVAGACTILLEDRLLDEVVMFLRAPDAEPMAGSGLQDRLMGVVASNLASHGALKTLSSSSGRLVDLIDDPAGYGDLDSRVTRASTRIRDACGR